MSTEKTLGWKELEKLEEGEAFWNGAAEPVDVHGGLNAATVARFEEDCFKCAGTGNWRPGYPCFRCKGTGKLHYKTSPETRAEQKARRIQRKADDAVAKIEAGDQWLADNPEIAIYLKEENERGNDFAASMLSSLRKYGSLTENMINGIQKGTARKAEWAEKNAKESAARNERTADANLNLDGLLAAFAAAVASGLKAPKLIVGNLRIARAKDSSRNPGYLYVNLNAEYYEDRTYLGKICPDGNFFAGRDCTDEIFEDIKKLSGDVLAAAQAHGALTGNCSMCNRALTNAKSVELGVGPICRERWGL